MEAEDEERTNEDVGFQIKLKVLPEPDVFFYIDLK